MRVLRPHVARRRRHQLPDGRLDLLEVDVASSLLVSSSSRRRRAVTGLQVPAAARRVYVHTHTHTHTDTHTHTFNDPLSTTTRVSRWYQKGKSNLDFTEARDSEWQWHQLGRMQVCTSLQTDNHASNPPLSFFTGRMPFLPPNQQRQSTEGRVYLSTFRSMTFRWRTCTTTRVYTPRRYIVDVGGLKGV